MADPRLTTLLYHVVPTDVAAKMAQVRENYYWLAELVVAVCPESRLKSLALTALEDSCMRAIQALAMQGTPVPIGTVHSGAPEDK